MYIIMCIVHLIQSLIMLWKFWWWNDNVNQMSYLSGTKTRKLFSLMYIPPSLQNFSGLILTELSKLPQSWKLKGLCSYKDFHNLVSWFQVLSVFHCYWFFSFYQLNEIAPWEKEPVCMQVDCLKQNNVTS